MCVQVKPLLLLHLFLYLPPSLAQKCIDGATGVGRGSELWLLRGTAVGKSDTRFGQTASPGVQYAPKWSLQCVWWGGVVGRAVALGGAVKLPHPRHTLSRLQLCPSLLHPAEFLFVPQYSKWSRRMAKVACEEVNCGRRWILLCFFVYFKGIDMTVDSWRDSCSLM